MSLCCFRYHPAVKNSDDPSLDSYLQRVKIETESLFEASENKIGKN